ncbi:hypothetical protein IW140_005896 [Coemansia sp. RSA 1813]|nr:hypothetical protein EV178_005886 [Coemansia sp. RSA 1646]KAJ1767642.1 hypothetical protein LPJ74_005251 [Coemansia sp. RSA 1843]KAJ2086251.1 hypothetical protein IW138_005808 [Coemansia sp. RSA 986]KAJ2210921.1 hypothetical protein EV179_005879 [Coemansia sp. RSA 487]KAJ2564012.1 hypothetical protein IW140_005896 [Coemansia sp. RSA 1813]
MVDAESRSNSEGNLSSSYSPFSDSQIDKISRQHCFVASTVTPVDAAGIRVLLVPVGPVRQERMLHWANAIAQFSRLPISDIMSHVETSLAAKYSVGSHSEDIGGGMDAEGELRFLFSVDANEDHEYLEGLQTYRQTLGVIGILDCQLCDNVTECYEEFLHILSRHTTAVAYRCWAFDPLPDQPDDVPGVTVIPDAGGSLLSYLQTLLCDFAGTMVSALDLMAKSIEDKSGLQTPTEQTAQSPFGRSSSSLDKDAVSPATSSSFDIHNRRRSVQEASTAAAQTMTKRISQASIGRRESTQSLPAGDAAPGGGGGGGSSSSGVGANETSEAPQGPSRQGRFGGEIDRDFVAANIDRSDASKASVSPSNTTFSSSMREKKQTANNAIGDSVNVGRLKKLQGDLFLMSGRLAEACNAFTASIDVSRTFTDYLWQAVAMEGYCAALLQMCERQNERRLVDAYLSTIPKTSVSESAFSLASIRASMTRPPQTTSTLKGTAATGGASAAGNEDNGASGVSVQTEEFSLVEALGSIGGLFGQIPLLYEKCFTFTPLLHAEACIREALVLFATRESFLHDPERALNSLLEINRLHPRSVNAVSLSTRDVVANTQNIPLRSVINDWLQRGWTSSFSSLALSDQLEMSSEISGMFRGLGYNRKSFFFLRQFLLMAIPILLRTSATGSFRGNLNNSSSSAPVRQSESSAHGYSGMSMLPDGASAFAAVSAAASAASGTTGSQWQSSQPHHMLLNTSGINHPSFESGGASNSDANTPGGATTALSSSLKEWAGRSNPTLKQAMIACLDALIHLFGAGAAKANTIPPKHALDGSDFGPHSGWLSIQADAIRECLSIAEALPSYPHAIAAGFRLVSCLNELAATVSDSQNRALLEEQHMVRNYLNRTIAIYHQQYHFVDSTSLWLETPIQSTVSEQDSRDDRPHVVGRDAAVIGGALDSLLVGIQFCTFPGNSAPISVSSKANVSQTESPSLFLHNPSAQLQGDTPPLLAAHEDVYFVATLSNPFPFGLQLNEVALIASIASEGPSTETANKGSNTIPKKEHVRCDNDIKAELAQCFIPAGAQGQVLLKITPKVAGQLKVKGVRLSLFQHLSVQCILAQEKEGDAKQRMREHPLRQRLEIERNSLLGLGKPLPGSPSVRLSTMNAGYLLSTTVVPSLPKLSVIESSLAREESLSLYEGESRVIRIVVVNGSSIVAAEPVSVAFEPLSDDRKSADDPKADLRMCDLVDSAFSYMYEPGALKFDPQQSCCLQVRVAGLAGLKGGEVVMRYGNNTVPEWSRELRWPVSISVARLVVPSVDKGDGSWTKYTDLPPYIARSLCSSSDTGAGTSGELVKILREACSAGADNVYDKREGSAQDLFYLAELNLQNMGPTEMQLTIETDLSGNRNKDADSLHMGTIKDAENSLVKTLVANMPGHGSLTRVILPLRRTCLSSKTASSPMPGIEVDGGPDKGIFYSWRNSLLRDEESCKAQDNVSQGEWRQGDGIRRKRRQFVVSQTANMSKDELAMRRKVYWCQLDIASRVRIRWQCKQSGRSGYIDPRLFFVLREQDLHIVRPKDLHVQVSVNDIATERVDRGMLQAKCVSREQSTIKLVLTNRLASSLDLSISVYTVSKVAAGVDESQLRDNFEKNDMAPELTADAYYCANASCSINARATANVCLGFASGLPDSRVDFSKGRFVFRPASGGLGTDGSLSAKDPSQHPDPNILTVSPLQSPRGLSFDDIQNMRLPTISPGEPHTIVLPVYILHPGRYQLEYKVSKKQTLEGSPGNNIAEDLVHEVLVIDGVG